MTTTLIIARHGNTFTPTETPRRVGKKTNIPLVEKGRLQAQRMATYLKDHDIHPDHIYTSTLKRTEEMAIIINKTNDWNIHSLPLTFLDEIDYGEDENKTEAEVINRIGEKALHQWDNDATVPEGWNVSPEDIKKDWYNFAEYLVENQEGNTVMCITSNGIARFAPHILTSPDTFRATHSIKIKTGALCVFKHNATDGWTCQSWNERP